MKKKLVLLSAALLAAGTMAAQTVVKGRVLDQSGNPVAGASVKANGKVVALTDNDGNFSISKLPAGVKRVSIGYVGMNVQTVDIIGKTKCKFWSERRVIWRIKTKSTSNFRFTRKFPGIFLGGLMESSYFRIEHNQPIASSDGRIRDARTLQSASAKRICIVTCLNLWPPDA